MLLLLSVAAVVHTVTATGAPPHIVHLMADDTGWNDLGFKNKLIHSPNIDKLAMEGIRMTRHHAFKVCSPSRSSFHTGRYGFSLGLYDNSPEAVPWIKFNDQAVPQSFTLLPELLKTKGYATHAVGKWHLGYATKAYTPTKRGYDTFFGYYSAMTEDYWEHTHSVASGCSLGPHSRDLHDSSVAKGLVAGTDNGTYEGTLFGERAVELILNHTAATSTNTKQKGSASASASTTPFFMYLAFHNEHDPHQAPLSALQSDTVGMIKSDVYKVTAALIETMDFQIGRVVDALNSTGMLANTVIGFSSDNGGPLDHANNFPFRGGKHTFWEGGVRSEAFIWSPLIPPSRRGSEWAGLAHIADWFYTYAVGVAGVSITAARGAGPYPDDATNLWSALTAPDGTSASSASPRLEVVHMVHSPKYFPGNCTISCWGGRSCPEVITVGDMKLSVGFIGDPRIVTMKEMAGVDANSTAGPFPWGATGGTCNVHPPSVTGMFVNKHGDSSSNTEDVYSEEMVITTNVEVNDGPDPNCTRGVLSKVDHAHHDVTCCSASCGTCGGASCASHPGGMKECCRGNIKRQGRNCNKVGPPCVEGGSPPGPPSPSPPGPFADRCTAPKLGGSPKPTPHGQCVDGCLFNVTADPTEANNLYTDPAYAALIAQMKARLATLGAAAPPWAAVPEVANMSKSDFSKAKCDAAKRFGALAPIDI